MTSRHFLSGIQYDVVTTPLPSSVSADHDVKIALRDGVRLAASVYRPVGDHRSPVIMAISPYGKTAFDAISVFSTVPGNHIGHINISDSVSFEAADPAFWVDHGYVVVQIDVRGQGASEGDTMPLGVTEGQDFQDVIAWAAEQDWSDGNIGLLGVSYLAITQWMAAQHRPPALKAIVPWEGFTDTYLRNYLGGIPETGMVRFVTEDWILPNHNPSAGFAPPVPGFSVEEHPTRDWFWDMQRIAVENVDIPVLLCASFSDQGLHTRDSFENFNLVKSEYKWLYSHRQPKWHAFYSEEGLAYQLKFLDRFLKGSDNGFEQTLPVRLEIHQTRDIFKVIQGETWPLANIEYRSLFLTQDRLDTEPSAQATCIEYDSSSGSANFDCVFDKDTDIVGNMNLKIWVQALDADEMDLFAAVRKFDTGGDEVYFYGFGGTNPNDAVARGWLKVSHRQIDVEASRIDRPVHTHREPQKLSPDDIVQIEIEILPSGTTFLAGETLRVTIQGKAVQPDASLLEFNPDNKGRHVIWTGGTYDSQLIVPVLKE